MQTMIDYGKSEGLQTISGQVLNENVTMLSMCRNLGFDVKADPDDLGVQIVTLSLRPEH